ncbi:YkvA family protein [Paenibacillus sp. GCM10023252]|uniref:YkvA family protein n=1 Tax=Paenibacillus sp. GCM10023252 TaxID=3252649 RepID=UPI00361800D8
MNYESGQLYSEATFWNKVKRFGRTAGSKVVYHALLLFYALQSPKVPAWAKTVIIGALAYFISPLDAIPDIVPAAGYTDDLGTLAAALGTIAVYINDDIRNKAADKLASWFSMEGPSLSAAIGREQQPSGEQEQTFV